MPLRSGCSNAERSSWNHKLCSQWTWCLSCDLYTWNSKLTLKAAGFAHLTRQNWIASPDFYFYLPGKNLYPPIPCCGQDLNHSESFQHQLGYLCDLLSGRYNPKIRLRLKYCHFGGICGRLKQTKSIKWTYPLGLEWTLVLVATWK